MACDANSWEPCDAPSKRSMPNSPKVLRQANPWENTSYLCEAKDSQGQKTRGAAILSTANSIWSIKPTVRLDRFDLQNHSSQHTHPTCCPYPTSVPQKYLPQEKHHEQIWTIQADWVPVHIHLAIQNNNGLQILRTKCQLMLGLLFVNWRKRIPQNQF